MGIMSLGERIKSQRVRCGMSQERVAELVGVSRQAVTKWESGQSAPSTENLFRLAQVFGTSVDLLLDGAEEAGPALAEQIVRLQEQEAARRAAMRRVRRRRNLLAAGLTAAGYLLLYLLGRLLNGAGSSSSLTGWLFEADPARLSYLYGWLLTRRLFWMAMAISVLPAFWGRYRFSAVTLAGFALGLLLGEGLGEYPPGAAWGHGHYGWAIWGGIFLFSVAMGAVLERLAGRGPLWHTRRLRIWCAVCLAGAAAVLLLIWLSIPRSWGR